MSSVNFLITLGASDTTVEIVASGISCHQQIEHVAGQKAKHLAEVLWEALQ